MPTAALFALALLLSPSPTELAVEAHGFALTCPAGWEARERALPAAAACVSPAEGQGDFLENVIVMVDERPGDADARSALERMLAGNADIMTPLERGSLEGEGWSAATVLTRGEHGRLTLSAAIRGNERLYLLTCRASDAEAMAAYRPSFEQVIRSFRLSQAPAVAAPAAEGGGRHVSPMGLSLVLPPGWTAIEAPDGPSSLALLGPEPAPGQVRPNLVVIARDHPRSVTAKELESSMVAALPRQWGNYRKISQSKLQIDGRKSRRIVFVGEQGGVEAQVAVTMVADGKRSYMIMGASSVGDFAENEAAFDTILDGATLN